MEYGIEVFLVWNGRKLPVWNTEKSSSISYHARRLVRVRIIFCVAAYLTGSIGTVVVAAGDVVEVIGPGDVDGEGFVSQFGTSYDCGSKRPINRPETKQQKTIYHSIYSVLSV